jgi:hypothetical protein
LPETFSPTALNRKLAIVGLKLPANWPPVGVVWTPTEGVTALPLPPDAQWANPTSINDRGEVAGITVTAQYARLVTRTISRARASTIKVR